MQGPTSMRFRSFSEYEKMRHLEDSMRHSSSSSISTFILPHTSGRVSGSRPAAIASRNHCSLPRKASAQSCCCFSWRSGESSGCGRMRPM